MKTIRQIADEIGVSKQAVFKKIKHEPLSTSLQGLTATVDGRLMVWFLFYRPLSTRCKGNLK